MTTLRRHPPHKVDTHSIYRRSGYKCEGLNVTPTSIFQLIDDGSHNNVQTGFNQ